MNIGGGSRGVSCEFKTARLGSDSFWEAAADILLRVRVLDFTCSYFITPADYFEEVEIIERLIISCKILCKKIDKSL